MFGASRPTLKVLAGVALLCLASPGGCTSTVVTQANAVPAKHAEQEIPSAQLLNVNISTFDPGIPDDPEEREEADLFPEVRKAEARYMPYILRQTLEETGYWGAVRVVPEPVEYSELSVTGKIVESNGMILKLRIAALDATGRVWLDRVYEQETTRYNFTESLPHQEDPFQGLYNRVANDLLEARQALAAEELRDIQRLSELRFAAELAPEAFAPYLARENGHYRVAALPAEDDPMVARIRQIRRRDYAVIDALDQHYRLFHDRLTPTYDNWRSASYAETKKLRELRKQEITRKVLGVISIVGGIVGLSQSGSSGGALASGTAIAGGAYLFGSGIEKGREAKIHADALEELGQSLERDVAPQVVELEGQTVTLSGSAQSQYEEWRRLLKDIYAAETGFTSGSKAPATADDL